ncbi:(d)CMP kinase [Pseudonocardiaceae bacterium YIM PH 21723]|nr:(d)CMP kinase [Pseudonocardiaceae bacterium YIM PH 21723]
MERGTLRGVIAVDGPSGTGKSTVARRLAAGLGARYLDTGAMYRAVTVAVLRAGADPANADEVLAVLAKVELNIGTDPEHPTVHLAADDVAAEIREASTTAAVSAVAVVPQVREQLIAQQRRIIAGALGEIGGIVVEGRDIGTVVAPDAALKIYLTASAERRAERRSRQDTAAGRAATVQDTLQAVQRRDAADAAQMQMAGGAELVDTSDLDINGVVDALRGLAAQYEIIDCVGAASR